MVVGFGRVDLEYNQTLTVRDRAIIYVLFDTGIRASELCGLTLDNVYLRADDAYIKVLGVARVWPWERRQDNAASLYDTLP